MVTLDRMLGAQYNIEIDKAPLEKVADAGNFVTKEFYDYCLPLIGEPIPDYARLTGKAIKLKDPSLSLSLFT